MLKNTENTSYAGAVVAGYLGHLTWGDLGAIFGILIALFTFLINWHYKHKADRRAEKLLQHQLSLRGDHVEVENGH